MTDLHKSDGNVDVDSEARARLFETASHLFYYFGYQAVGVDRIAEESGVAKMTLYRHFPSKDDLIVAHLEKSAADFWEWFDAAVAGEPDAAGRLMAVFKALEEQCRSARCAGCAFQRAATEFPDRDHPAARIARTHKEDVRQRIETLATEAKLIDPSAVANQLILLMEGALASVRLLSLPVPAREVSAAARILIASHRQDRSS